MVETALFEAGNYRYRRGPFQYSAGVCAEPGYGIERVRFAEPVPVAAGFKVIEDYLTGLGRPLTCFCACELRSPAPFDDAGFIAFNRVYVGTLERWGIFKEDDNPVARSNVCPELNPPPEPGFHAFSYTVPVGEDDQRPSFVISGSAEAREGAGDYSERTIRLGETGADAMREKASYVLGVMETRMKGFGLGWSDASATQVYTVHELHSFLADEIVSRGAARNGLTWHYARPPVFTLDYEMDVHGVAVERLSRVNM